MHNCPPHLSALEVCSRRGAIQIHTYTCTRHNGESHSDEFWPMERHT